MSPCKMLAFIYKPVRGMVKEDCMKVKYCNRRACTACDTAPYKKFIEKL